MALQNNTRLQLFYRPSLYYGLYSRVARQLGVDPGSVRRVAIGQRNSRRIRKALEAEVRRVERKAAKVA